MDKNTLTGLLLMGVVLFGFMYCGRQDADKQQTPTEQTATDKSADKAQSAENTDDPATALTKQLTTLVNANGTVITGDTTHRAHSLTDDKMSLVTDTAGNLSGTIIAGGVTYDIAQLVSPTSTLDAKEREAAITAITKSLADTKEFGVFAAFTGGTPKTLTLANNKMRVSFDSRGGRISQVELLDYKTETGETPVNVKLFTAANAAYDFVFETADRRINTGNLNFNLDSIDKNTVRMSLPLADGKFFAIKYRIDPDDYIVKMDIEQNGLEDIIPATRSTMKMNWHVRLPRLERGRTFEERNSAIYYKIVGETPEDLESLSDDNEDVVGSVKWVAFKDQYFSSVIVPRTTFSAANLTSHALKDDPTYVKDMTMEASFAYASDAEQGPGFDFFFGPNEYSLLSSLDEKISPDEDLELTRLVPLGWGLFRWVNKFIIVPVFDFLSFLPNYGLVILVLTIFIKLILFPFTYKSYMSQAKMRVLAPEIKEINEKYPGQENAMKRQQENMKLYQRAGASPFSGCLPMLLQMPVLIAVFSFLPSAIELRGESFLWAHDLSAPDTIFTLPFSIPFYGDKVSLFCLLMTIVNIVYARINMQNQPGGSSMPGMKWMMYLMPVMFLFFFNDYASGLSYYYFLSLLITIIQTYIFRRCVNEEKVRAQMLENSKKPRKKTGFMARLEAAQKRQEAMMREQAKKKGGRR